ncbi:MAG TPA: hypothetical protein VGL82_05690 [Bryobacteraceae bacterium]
MPDLCGLEQHHLNLLLGNRAMLYPAGHDDKVALCQHDAPVAEVHPKAPAQYQELIWTDWSHISANQVINPSPKERPAESTCSTWESKNGQH